jgi:hypothetical protein
MLLKAEGKVTYSGKNTMENGQTRIKSTIEE